MSRRRRYKPLFEDCKNFVTDCFMDSCMQSENPCRGVKIGSSSLRQFQPNLPVDRHGEGNVTECGKAFAAALDFADRNRHHPESLAEGALCCVSQQH